MSWPTAFVAATGFLSFAAIIIALFYFATKD